MRASLALAFFLLPGLAHAEPLRCLPKLLAQRALGQLRAGALLIDFCSTCNAKAAILKIKDAQLTEGCAKNAAGSWTVEVSGRVLARTQQRFETGYDQSAATYADADERYSARVDLADLYIEVEPNRFSWLGREVGLKTEVKTAQIHLPQDTYRSLGAHPLAPIAQRKAKHPLPTPKEVQRVWHHYLYGQGRGPILGELLPCLEVDERRVSSTRWECLIPARGSVPAGERIYAWMAWLVPRDTETPISVEFLHEGTVRHRRSLTLKSLGLRQRSFPSARLSRPGRWTIVVKEGEVELEKAELTISSPVSAGGRSATPP